MLKKENMKAIKFAVSKMYRNEKIALLMICFEFQEICDAKKILSAEYIAKETRRILGNPQ